MNESASVATHEYTHTHMKTIRHQIITNEAERVWQLKKVQKLQNKASKLLAKCCIYDSKALQA